MKTVNAKLYAIKYRLKKLLEESITKDNEAIKNGATLTMQKYAKIQVVKCTRKSYTKEQQAILDEIAKEKGFEKQETEYLRIDIDSIDPQVDTEVGHIISTIEADDNATAKRVASKVGGR